MFTFDQAVLFLKDILQMENVDKKLEDRLQLLEEIVRRFHQFVPFQNLTLLAQDPDDRRLPTLEDVIKSVGSGEGGICYSLATFVRVLLLALGYDAFAVACSIRPSQSRPPFTHVATVARGVVHAEDLYLIEVGTSFPTFQPIPLHQLPQQYRDAFHEYKYVQEGGEFVRYLRQKPGSSEEEWFRFYQFQPIPRDDSFLKQYQEPVYIQPGYGAKWYLVEIKMSIYPEDMAVTINQNCLKVWHRHSNEMQVLPLNTTEEYKEAVTKYFPMLANVDTGKALATADMEKDKVQQTQKV